jgi:hypothetical protein
MLRSLAAQGILPAGLEEEVLQNTENLRSSQNVSTSRF